VHHAAPSGEDIRNVYQANIWPGRYYNTLAQISTRNPTNITSVDASGRVSNVRYYVSGSYQHEQGALKLLNGYQVRRGRVNLDYNARQDMIVSVSSMYSESNQDRRNPGQGFGGLLRGAPPGTDYLAIDTLGRRILRGGGNGLRGTGNGDDSFLYDVDGNRFETRTADRYLANVSARYFPADWVTVEGSFAYDNRSRFDEEIVRKGYRTFTLSPNTNGGNMDVENRDDNSLTASLTSTFRKQLTPDLNGKLQFRGLYDEENQYTNGVEGDVFLVKDIHTLDNLSENFDPNSSLQTTVNVGFFAATSLDYKDKYIFDGTFRYDGSSRFGAGNRWAPFSRVSAVWRVSEEDFWNVGYLSDFRLRASRGTAGSTPRFSAQYETYDVATDGIALGQAGNSKLKPETTTEYEVGTDFTVLDRLGVEFTYAHATTEDQILNVSTPASLGFTSQWQNAGTLLNKTFEVALNLPVLNTRDFSWSMRGTWDRTRTYITELFAPEYVTSAGTTQGTGSMFFITANDSVINGFQMNRYGNIWGRRFYEGGCSSMPAALQPFCGEGQHFQVNDQGWVVWVGQGNSWRDGITRNLWQTQLPACNLTGAARTPEACLAAGRSPFGSALLWFGHPIVDRPLAGQSGEGSGIQQPIGNVFPDFRFTWGNTLQYKRLGFYALFDGTMGHDIYNQGEGWGLLDYNSSYFDMAKKTVETAKPVGYGWRVGAGEGAGTGGFYDLLGPNSYVVEDGSYVKVRELSLMYRVGAVRGVGDWTLGIVGRNMFTFTNYTGYDPETGATGGTNEAGSGLINQVDAFGFPTLRTYTFTLTSRF
jgi:hypothetical protein